MPKTKRSIRDELSEALIISIADVFEENGIGLLRRLLKDEPGVVLDLLSRCLRAADVECVMELGGDAPDDLLREISRRVAVGLRRGTAAEGKPPPNRLN